MAKKAKTKTKEKQKKRPNKQPIQNWEKNTINRINFGDKNQRSKLKIINKFPKNTGRCVINIKQNPRL
jgi:hypothetical protein